MDNEISLLRRDSFKEPIDKENSAMSSNIIINNALIDSMLPDNISKTLNQNDIDSALLQIRNKKRILSFTNKSNIPNNKDNNPILRKRSSRNLIENVKEIYETNLNMYKGLLESDSMSTRKISLEPERVLDAPNLVDDYYLNLLDWSSQNLISICLGQSVYLWNANTTNSYLLTKVNDDEYICSVSFMNNGTCLAVGRQEGIVELWDIDKQIQLRTLNGHSDRVSSLSWNNYILSTGGRDSQIINHDVRIKDSAISKVINGHNKEVCALKWNLNNNLLASGANDNKVCIWDIRKSKCNGIKSIWSLIENQPINNINEISPLYTFIQHEAAVKALAWSPYNSNILASGGGKKDNTIKFWNMENGTLLNSFNTGSQVCNLLWNKYEREIISGHGYSKNQISIWKYPKLTKEVDLEGHLNRVLYMAMSPDGCTLVSGSADETLRFWNINDKSKIKQDNNKFEFSNEFMGLMDIR